MASGLLLAVMAMATPAAALDRAQLAAGLAAFREPGTVRSLENRLVSLVERKDAAGLRTLASEIRRKDGAILDGLEALAKEVRASGTASDPDLARLAMSIGPCQHANLLVRRIVLAIAAGEVDPVLRDDAVRLRDSPADGLYPEMILRCEKLAGLPARTPRLGGACPPGADACGEGQVGD
jgi:hypothetical protein